MRSALLLGFALWVLCSGIVSAQVFTQDPGAVVGFTDQGTGQALYGGFGLDSANNPEYRIYRKFTQRDDETPQAVATNVEGNAGEVEWTGVNQLAGTTVGITAPGMFIGAESGDNGDGTTTSDPTQLLYFKPLVNVDGTPSTGDSNDRAQWDTRFGFMEKPDDYIDFVAPNSNQLDLWTGQYNTDAVYTQNIITRDDSAATTNVQQAHTRNGSFMLQSGDELTEITTEQDRDNYALTRVRVGSGEELDDASAATDTGVAYDDPIEVSWGMRLNDPENPIADLAREVLFWVKTGNLVSSGIFDPGDEDNLPFDVPNPTNDDLSDFTDGFFDWENAFPVFFAGGQGNIGNGIGGMGIFIPGDYDASGAVDVDDFNRFAASYDAVDTTYSTGDQTQDGMTDVADGQAWGGVASQDAKLAVIDAVNADIDAGGSFYDFNGSGMTDDGDLTFVVEDLFGIVGTPADCNGDGVVDIQDANCTPVDQLDDFLAALDPPSLRGDADGDGEVQFSDFVILSENFTNLGVYTEGDFDKDGEVQFSDFVILSESFGQSGAAVAAAVPEPTAALLLAIGLAGLTLCRHRKYS